MSPAVIAKPVIDVAAAVMRRADDRVLLAERPPGKAWAGYWEFPGGKCEHGEGIEQALARELHEELGVTLDAALPWLVFEYAYPEKTVRLHFFRVTAWRGTPHGREGQRVSWEDPCAPSVAPLLPANERVLHALSLPVLYAITQAAHHGIPEFMPRLEAALDQGVRLIQVRERAMSPGELASFAQQVVITAHRHGARVLINGDASLATRVGADGVHLQGAQLREISERPRVPLVGASCHDAGELARAAGLGADFALLSPVLPTASHPGETGIGWETFQAWARDCPIPVYALGGMQRALLDSALRHGAQGIALLSDIWRDAADAANLCQL